MGALWGVREIKMVVRERRSTSRWAELFVCFCFIVFHSSS